MEWGQIIGGMLIGGAVVFLVFWSLYYERGQKLEASIKRVKELQDLKKVKKKLDKIEEKKTSVRPSGRRRATKPKSAPATTEGANPPEEKAGKPPKAEESPVPPPKSGKKKDEGGNPESKVEVDPLEDVKATIIDILKEGRTSRKDLRKKAKAKDIANRDVTAALKAMIAAGTVIDHGEGRGLSLSD